MSFTYLQLLIGLSLGALIGWLAYRSKALSKTGGWAAACTGGLIFGLGGFTWAILLLTFFVSSSALSRIFARQKTNLGDTFAKGSQRDWGQVLANGGLGTVLVIAHTIYPNAQWPWLAYMGAMAAVNADTWATEIGVLSKHPPRLITTWQTIDHGASGGITLLGTAATIAGSALIALFAGIFTPPNFNVIFFIVTLSGLLGSLFDSLLGATVQAIYHCPVCQKETEHHPLHSCGAHTSLKRGWNWFNNDLVNFSASITGAFVVLVIASVFN